MKKKKETISFKTSYGTVTFPKRKQASEKFSEGKSNMSLNIVLQRIAILEHKIGKLEKKVAKK